MKYQKIFDFLRTWFFVAVASILAAFLFNFCNIYSEKSIEFRGVLIFLAILALTTLLRDPIKQLKTQRIHDKPSWFFYLYWSLFLFPFSLYVLKIPIVPLPYPVFIFIFGILIYMLVDSKNYQQLRFAASSVGMDDDELDFKFSALNISLGLKSIQDYVSVVGVYGKLGEGKSSYARMIIENLNQGDQILYTYISLTETNATKDFSQLFSERLFETLSSKYPKINTDDHASLMRDILRDNGHNVWSSIIQYVHKFNCSLLGSINKTQDEGVKININKTSGKISGLFGGISEIQENFWVIMIDEIERAQFEEVYRVVEIIERFKNEGRHGMPVKLMFILCISNPDFENMLNTYRKSDQKSFLLKQFFYQDPKSVTHKIYLPTVDPDTKQRYLINKLNKIITDLKIDEGAEELNGEVYPRQFLDSHLSFPKNHKEALGYSLGIFDAESPRMVNRCLQEISMFYNSFFDKNGNNQINAIRFNDVLLLSYIKIKYPFLIDFFRQTIHLLIDKNPTAILSAHMQFSSMREQKINVVNWVEKITGKKIQDKKTIEGLIRLVAYYYIDKIEKDYTQETKYLYSGTTSYPEILDDYLRNVSGVSDSPYRRSHQVYLNHQKNKSFIKTISNEDLVAYARFLSNMTAADFDIKISVLDELSDRLCEKKFQIIPMEVGDTIYDEAIYQFEFLLASALDTADDQNDYVLAMLFHQFKKVLLSTNVITVGKFIILNSFANNQRGGATEIHSKLQRAFNVLLKHRETEIKSIINYVFNEFNSRYISGEKIIYDEEENFFYLLYQSWSGDKNNKEEINQIQQAAFRGLNNNIKAIKLYWHKYPFDKKWTKFEDVLQSDHFFKDTKNNNVYMPLNRLIEFSNNVADEEIQNKIQLWQKFLESDQLGGYLDLPDDAETLKSVLIKRNLIVQ